MTYIDASFSRLTWFLTPILSCIACQKTVKFLHVKHVNMCKSYIYGTACYLIGDVWCLNKYYLGLEHYTMMHGVVCRTGTKQRISYRRSAVHDA
jgi:hypothetical protein